MAEELEIENASTMRKGEMMFQILREGARGRRLGDRRRWRAGGAAGRVRLPALARGELPAGPDDIYVSPDMIRQYSLRTGDTVEGVIRAPRENERYFALTKSRRSTSRIPRRRATRSPSTT
jgi:transcription termination factor Rho